MMDDFLRNTKSAFDKVAIDYDENDSGNDILKWMRDIVHTVYLKYLKSFDKVLELNSGTGLDAVFLAKKGFKVFATDISDNMINILIEKIKTHGLEDKIYAEALPFSEINYVDRTNFNAVVSNFGGLNCINNFSKLNTDIYNKLNSGGYFIAVVMNIFCPWEIIFYALKFDFKTAFRRFRKVGTDALLEGEKVRTFYYTPRSFGKCFSNNFNIRSVYSLGLLTPPPYLTGVYRKLKPVIRFMMRLDNLIKGIPVLNFFGDHFIIIMKKK